MNSNKITAPTYTRVPSNNRKRVINQIDINLFNYLVNIYGIGRSRAVNICQVLGFLPTTPWKKLSIENQSKVDHFIKDISKTEWNDMRNSISTNVKINSVRGIRMRLGRPVRGQRTQTNANTAQKLNIVRVRKG